MDYIQASVSVQSMPSFCKISLVKQVFACLDSKLVVRVAFIDFYQIIQMSRYLGSHGFSMSIALSICCEIIFHLDR